MLILTLRVVAHKAIDENVVAGPVWSDQANPRRATAAALVDDPQIAGFDGIGH